MSMEIVVDAPGIFPPLHNLIDSGNPRATGDGRWENGVQFNPEGCLEVHAHSIDCPSTDKSNYQACPGVVKFEPFILELGVTVPSTRHPDFKAVMQRQLDVSASSVIEASIWLGNVLNDDDCLTSCVGARCGDGIVREIELRSPGEITILSDRRVHPPYGLHGGEPGTCGRNTLATPTPDGSRSEEQVPGKISVAVESGTSVCIETPGGGGWGEAPGDSTADGRHSAED